VLLRYLTGDHPAMSERCRRLFERIEAGDETVYLPEAALAEVVWTLRSFYELPVERLCDFLGDLLAMDGVEMPRKELVWGALEHLRAGRLDFSDAMIAAESEARGLIEIYSFDRDFDRVPGLARVEP
jgi:predicted nucleic acid-binding protein